MFVFLVIWVPVIWHYYISNIIIPDIMVEKARHYPDDSILNELNRYEFRGLGLDYQWDNKEKLIEKAEKILLGIIPGLSYKIEMPFNADDISKGLPGEQLKLAGFYIPDLLLSAYQVTGREIYFTTARDVILAWALYERKIWLPRGMIWNDYAIAARNETLIKFWGIYRNHRTYQPEVAKVILQLVARSGEFLAKSSHFTVSSNHGVIQNLALLRLYLAFPSLPNVDRYKQIALNRLHDQMTFYINDEGVILEHSAHYQQFGVHLVGTLFRYLTLMNEPIPQSWKEKYEKAIDYLSLLKRPDGSLPMYGDTHGRGNKLLPPVTTVDDKGRSSALEYRSDWTPKHSYCLYPVAGYSIWWNGLDNWPDPQRLNQTVVVWSYFPGQAHKHADEMSVLFYAGDQTWWTNVGYWTYGVKGRSEADSWSGSDAPHLVGESPNSIRHTELKYHGWSDRLAVIDMERNGPDKYVARRQVLHFKPNLWLVVDHTTGEKNSQTTTTWTVPADVKLIEGKFPDSFYLRKDDKNLYLESFFLTSNKTRINHYRGSLKPFAGWVEDNPSDAIVIEQPSNNSWSVAIWSLGNIAESPFHYTAEPYVQKWTDPESWKILVPIQSGTISIWRDGNCVYASEGNKSDIIQKISLKNASVEITDDYAAIRDGYKNAAIKYPEFRDLLYYRWRITYILILLFISQEVFFFIYRKIKGKHYAGLIFLAMIGWAGIIGIWQLIVYLKA